MKRKELAALPELGVTDEMRELAYGDTGRYRVEKYSRGERNYTVYNYRVYLRASVMEGILRIEIYEGDDIRNCNEEARYVVFLSRKENRYTTYIPGEKRWSRAKIDNLEYGHYNWKDRYLNHYWITGKEEEIILHYLGAEYGGIYRTVSRWQTEAAHREEIRGIDRVMDQVPEQPEDFGNWAEEEVFWKHQYLFYSRERGEAYCTACKKTIKTKIKSKHNQYVRCPECGREVIAKSWKKQKVVRDNQRAVLIQKIPDGFIVREFYCVKNHELENAWKGRISLGETARELRNNEMRVVKEYEYGNFKQSNIYRWCNSGYVNLISRAVVYRKNLEEIFRGTELQNMPYGYLFREMKGCPVRTEKLFRPDGILERMIKTGLTRLSLDYMESGGFIRKKKGTAQEILEIDGNRINRLKKMNGGQRILGWLRYEQKAGTKIRQDVLIRLDREGISAGDLEEIVKYGISPERALNYIGKQTGQPKNLIITWKDYLRMAEADGYDTTDDIVRFPRDLKLRHDQMVEKKNEKKDQDRAREYAPLDQKIRKRLPEARRYYWQDEKYMIVPAAACIELIREGRSLHHCVGRDDHYMKKMAAGESWICFLRKKENPEKHWYTIEIGMEDDRIIQYYSEFDRQPDKKEVDKILQKFKRSIQRIRKKSA